MGNWKHRPQRRFYHQERKPWPPPPSFDDREPFHSGSAHDGIPLWEKKFCYVIGSVPWPKVVYAKKFMFCHGNVLNWDDSGSEVAFQNAKKRFWAEINGLHCDIPLPDPDIYVDQVNWNPDIDPALIKEVDQAYFAPDECGNDEKLRHKNKKRRNFVSVSSLPSDGCAGNSGHVSNPWEHLNNLQSSGVKDEEHGLNQWVNNARDSRNLTNADNPWECNYTQDVKSNTWGDIANNSWACNQSKDWGNGANLQDCSWNGVGRVKDRTWGNCGDAVRGWRQQESRKFDNGDNAREHSYSQNDGMQNLGGWTNYGGNAWSGERWDSCGKEGNNFDFRKTNGSRGGWNDCNQKREGNHQYVNTYKSSTFHGNDYQSGRYWRGRKDKKRVNFA
ncbi:hypothetical protein HS088_TW09G00472 [Tripterygium wilfordii]|uniref:Uncharacterized protein n=1 Tax=Tripterygium wilfordii TaxID=458696 RepID=A0A7J7D7Y4_TRIWF|nr:uncharacterized protein LOC120006198 [Tripterygium wilfordii]KAF5742424.1 hypothetical protein HS088_TW09G00472 [Tripterygium wilfordii]